MFKVIDSYIDKFTMYKLMQYYLRLLIVAAVALSALGVIHYNAFYIVISSLVFVTACWIFNKAFAFIFNAPTNIESPLITGLILTLIIPPTPTGYGLLFMLAASGLAMASKYLLTINKKHIFNPAAVAVALTALGPRQTASWWIGTAAMLPFVLLGGIIIARKIRRGKMVTSFFASVFVATILYSLLSKVNVMTSLHNMIFTSSAFFLGFVMLTEPETSPVTAKTQSWYAVLVGFLLPPQVHAFSFYSSPELALLAGNVFSYIISPKIKFFPTLKQKVNLATNTIGFEFVPGQKFNYKPGQYMEWTLPHSKADRRGVRRYFTLASSPTEPDISIGVKFYDKGSSFKKTLMNLNADTPVVVSGLGGEFVLPDDQAQKLAFIAGGIGITPFRSMVRYLTDKNEQRTATLIYSVKSEADIAYKEIFEAARQKIGLQTIYTITDGKTKLKDELDTMQGYITPELIQQAVPDYMERIFYVSGTHQMVEDIQDILVELGVSHSHIKTDFFPGYTS